MDSLLTNAAHESSVVSVEWVLAASAAVLGFLAWFAQRSRIPYPIFLVLAGLGIGFVPGVPTFQLDPDVVFLVFLPPLIYAAAYFTSLRELRANARPISFLALGLVLATMATVAVVAHALVGGMPWSVAFVLGAIVSPTDPVAGTAVLERFRVPRRVTHIVEGESLINDGSGIVLYRVAVAAVVSGSFSVLHAGVEFVASVTGGVAVGIVVGVAWTWLRRRNTHGPTDVLLSLLAGYVAYLPAEALHVSGVLAAATTSIWLGWRTPTIVRDAETRLQIAGVWTNASFVLNTVLFLLVGMQMHGILERIDGVGTGRLVAYAAAIGATVMATRLVWTMFTSVLPGLFLPALRSEGASRWRGPALVGWIGMRGAVSLAAALALPATIDGGAAFPQRDLVIFLAFGVIVMTLVVQGLTLGWVVEWLDMEDDGELIRSEAHARMVAARAAIARLDELQGCSWIHDRALHRLRGLHEYRAERFEARALATEEEQYFDERAEAWVRIARELHAAQRAAILELRDSGEITDEVMELVQRDLDLEDVRLGS
jgi:CPA1 family monovalent cation:H+ antiporter